jgi:hypothetical protein
MQKITLKGIIQEQMKKVQLRTLTENIVSDIISLILSPKIKKEAAAIKDDPEYKELERQAKLAQQELEAISKRIERNLEKRAKVVRDMKKAGIKVATDMNSTQMFQAYQDWSENIDKDIKARGTKSAWEKYFNKK